MKKQVIQGSTIGVRVAYVHKPIFIGVRMIMDITVQKLTAMYLTFNLFAFR